MDAALSKLAKKDVPYAKMIPVQKDSDKSEFVEAQDERWVTSLENGLTVFWLVGSCRGWRAATPCFTLLARIVARSCRRSRLFLS